MSLKISMPSVTELKPRICVFGVGGAGGNAVNNMIAASLEGVEFVVANTDAQALAQNRADRKIQIGARLTQGLGAGARPEVGSAAAEESAEEILECLAGSHMCFITAGMGGGTGTGAAPVIARLSREQGILTVGVVTKPFHFEGVKRMRSAEEGIRQLQEYVDTLIIIPNQNLFRVANEKTTFAQAFQMADEVLHSGVRGITDLMVMPGLINLDFNDVRTVMNEMGKAMMGTGEAGGDKRAIEAAEAAISNPLLDDVSMKGARGVLINITGGPDMTLFEVDEAANRIRAEVDPDANIIWGSTFDPRLEGKMRVSVVATGIEAEVKQKPQPEAQKPAVRPVAPARPAVAVQPVGRAAVAPHVPAAAQVAQPAQPLARETSESVASAPSPVHRHIEAIETKLAQPEDQGRSGADLWDLGGREAQEAQPARPVDSLRQKAAAASVQRVRDPEPGFAAEPPFSADQPAEKKRGFFGLFGTRKDEPKAELPAPRERPLRAQASATRLEPRLAETEARGPAERKAPQAQLPLVEDDALEIPAFLRRQAN